ncbi:MAG: sulfite exporter TauE/SafE family protein [Solirubrobacterales bacterium]|nr:sulfite exporter TauE/SafE family protein [Solirubrobacterales bacterium]MBV9537260.1 sulfite exporter TauE/SafE family protein [Solirubrobacterales bacterium]
MSEGLDKSYMLKLAVIGTAAGVFSGLLGVGGGTVIVPLLVLWLGYGEREATGTSLSAIAVIAAMATILQGAYGNVDLAKGLLVGLPAVVGVLIGAWLQQRVPTEVIGLLFAVVLVAAAVDLVLT